MLSTPFGEIEIASLLLDFIVFTSSWSVVILLVNPLTSEIKLAISLLFKLSALRILEFSFSLVFRSSSTTKYCSLVLVFKTSPI